MWTAQVYPAVIKGLFSREVKMMLHGTIRNDDFQRNTTLQHCFEQLQHRSNIATLGPLKIVLENRLGQGIIYEKIDKLFEELEFCV